jgi:hypothetical protein
LLTAALATSLGAAGQVQVDFVVNGDFEAVQIGSPFFSTNPADIPNWTHSGSIGDALLWHVGYADSGGSIAVAGSGLQFVTMGGGSNFSGTGMWQQTLTGLTPGNPYTLTFQMASETPSTSQSITVDFPSGSSTGPQAFTAGPSSADYWRNWETKTENFIATSSSVVLRFSATTQLDVGLDNVHVVAAQTTVPAPGGLVLLASGAFAGTGWVLRRYRRRK